MEFKDYYKVLGVDKTATADDIKKAFRKLARKHHPDVSKAADATAQMAAVNEANDVLSDPARRMAYDTLDAAQPAQRAGDGRGDQPPPRWDAGFEFSDAAADGSGMHSDFFEQLFGRAARGNTSAGGGAAQAAMRGSDHHAKIELDILDAYTGAERTLTLRAAREDGDGHTGPELHSLQVRIPKGVREGQHIRLAGRGGAGMGGAPAGDLLLEVLFRPDPRWRAEGRDVYQRLDLAPWEAQLGATVQVSAPGGPADVNVPAGWRPGRKLRLKDRGIPGAGDQPAGHLYLELAIALPAADSDAARAAYAALARAFPAFNARQKEGA